MKTMRLDKYVCSCTGLTRSQAGKWLRQGLLQVNGQVVKQASFALSSTDQVTVDGEPLLPVGLRYLIMHKPAGYVCTHDDPRHPAVFSLLMEPFAERIHSVGRLDVDTTGLLLLTDDGKWSHRLSSPRHHVPKTYRVWTAEPIREDTAARFAEGVVLHDDPQPTAAAQLQQVAPQEALLTIHEGRYHQVKRMFAAVGNHVLQLHREQIGGLTLPADLAVGDYRALSEEELALLDG